MEKVDHFERLKQFSTIHGPRSIELNDLEAALVYRAVNTEINLLHRLYPGDNRFKDQINALEMVLIRMEDPSNPFHIAEPKGE